MGPGLLYRLYTVTDDRVLNPFPVSEIFNFCHHVNFVSKPLLSAFFLDVERCCLDGT